MIRSYLSACDHVVVANARNYFREGMSGNGTAFTTFGLGVRTYRKNSEFPRFRSPVDAKCLQQSRQFPNWGICGGRPARSLKCKVSELDSSWAVTIQLKDSLCSRNRHASADHLKGVEHALENVAGQCGAVRLGHGVLNDIFANQIARGVHQQQATQFIDKPRSNAGEEALDAVLCNDFPERSQHARVLCLLTDELGHHPDRDDLKRLREDDFGNGHCHFPFQFLLKVLVPAKECD